jgi:hypothetical protein
MERRQDGAMATTFTVDYVDDQYYLYDPVHPAWGF